MTTLSEENYNILSTFVKDRFGLYFPAEKQRDLEREIKNVCPSVGAPDLSSLVDFISSGTLHKSQLEIIANALTIGETYFLREKKVFEIFEHNVIPEILNKKMNKKLTVWSAGCSTGEEVYTIAMILESLRSSINDWQIKIIGTDLNTTSLQKAEQGIYSQWSFRTTPTYMKDKYFTPAENGSFIIANSLRKNISFQYLNLADESLHSLFTPGSVDVIFCRNVLMYFSEATRERIIKRFKDLLPENGWLILSSSEISNSLQAHFKSVNFTNAILYKKEHGYTPSKTFSSSLSIDPIAPIINTINYQVVETSTPKAKPATNKYIIPDIQIKRPEEDIIKKAEEIFDGGRFHEVIVLLQKELAESRNYFQPSELEKSYLMMSKTYANLGKLEEAKKWCKESISINKVNPRTYYLLANILLEEGLNDEAMAALRSALFIEPNFVLALFTLGNILFKQGKIKEAHKQFENAKTILSSFIGHELVPESDGLTVSHLQEIIKSITQKHSSR